jgi:citrate lyase subunit beta/citryl-CoA lyase
MRSLLYIPAHNERFVARAHERGADAIILDLEDGVPLLQKDAARGGLAAAVRAVGQGGAKVFVRVNTDARQADDIAAVMASGAYGFVVPKAHDPDALDAFELPIYALIEGPGAVLDARVVARHPRVMALGIGSEDLTAVLGATPTQDVLRFPSIVVHYAAKAEGKLSFGLMQSIADYGDLDGLRRAARAAREHGFDGASCVHPSAVPVLNEAFAASADEIAWARRVLAADDGSGVFVVDGRMVDAPVVARARRVLAE